MSIDIGPRIGIDGEAEFRKELNNINQQVKTLGSEMKAVTSAFDANENSQENLAKQTDVLTRQITAQEAKLEQLQKGLAASAEKYGENDTKTLKWAQAVNNATSDLNSMRTALSKVEQQMAGASDATDELSDGLADAGDAAESSDSKFGAMTVALGSLASAGIQAAVSAIGDLIGSLINLDETTEEYRIAQGKLTTAFEAAGLGTQTAKTAYEEFYKILGDTDTATEASQLLAQLAQSEADVTAWTNIAAGVWGTYGDALPIEGLIEAANETAKVGEVTGTLADALNWAGISEGAFNAQLAACSSESERNQLIMDTLAATYSEASDAFYKNNETLVQSRENQAQMDETLAALGKTISEVKTKLASEFMPAITAVTSAFNDMLQGVEGADEQFAEAVKSMVNVFVENLPQFITAGVQIITALISGLLQSIPTLVASLPEIISAIVTGLLDLRSEICDVGMDLIRGLWEGIQGMASWLADKVSSFFSGIIDGVKDFLGIHSPSTVFAGIGENMALGIGRGFAAEMQTVAAQMQRAVPTPTIETVNNAAAGMVNGLAEIGGAARGDLTIIIQDRDAKEWYRMHLRDFRQVEAETPVIVNDF